MAKQASKFRDWLLDKRFFRVGWFAKDTHLAPEPEEALANLPDEVASALIDAANDLSAHPSATQAILDPLNSAIAQWMENPNSANNSIVFLAQPVLPVSLILGESLSRLDIENKQITFKLLDWVKRPPHGANIRRRLEKEIGPVAPKSDEMERPSAKQLTVIPNLCWCFLRSVQGLDGIDYMQDTVMNDSSQFMVLGCGQIGWEYLKSTLKFHAYCDQVLHLPSLSGEQLQEWLDPIISQFDIHFSDAALHKRLGNPNQLKDVSFSIDKPVETLSEIAQEATATVKSSVRFVKEAIDHDSDTQSASPKLEYFNRLANISDGISIVALQLFIRSLRYEKDTDYPTGSDTGSCMDSGSNKGLSRGLKKGHVNKQGTLEKSSQKPNQKPNQGSTQPVKIVAQLPKLPPLPELSQSDLYLLYALMLHGDLTIDALAESLGDSPQVVNNQVQVLRNEGVIEQKNGVIKTNPIHYPRLKRELANNNFIIMTS
ncbi:hypothetical protein S7335_2129 [Synechococcus sp. PCC 7335]|uniref:MarR family transcriptional regulator n=1 Tax=Synechococcus sp. (strain ATCC 29403 / PCC 7335) TaxID=91464 RepID=UPI00017ED8D0|nr:helix-turn-helix domain-containing protein [Synechococcus sp. PCC 7335]EDX84432.1 hypothetical protein S7335_2129 [Synechococcus sp. PCC 7335]